MKFAAEASVIFTQEKAQKTCWSMTGAVPSDTELSGNAPLGSRGDGCAFKTYQLIPVQNCSVGRERAQRR